MTNPRVQWIPGGWYPPNAVFDDDHDRHLLSIFLDPDSVPPAGVPAAMPPYPMAACCLCGEDIAEADIVDATFYPSAPQDPNRVLKPLFKATDSNDHLDHHRWRCLNPQCRCLNKVTHVTYRCPHPDHNGNGPPPIEWVSVEGVYCPIADCGWEGVRHPRDKAHRRYRAARANR